MKYDVLYKPDESAKQWTKLPTLRSYVKVRACIESLKTAHGTALRYRVITKDCEPMT